MVYLKYIIIKKKNIIYKKIECNNSNYSTYLANSLKNKLKNDNEFYIYKNIITNIYKKNIIGKYTIKGFDVERNGSYKCEYIEGFRLDKIPTNLTEDIKYKLIKSLKNLLYDINSLHITSGDWALHNIIFSDSIKNVDLEGFYSFQNLPRKWDIKSLKNILNCL